jgi:chromosome condensin MukBEF ATPase and DNA-binding subunit MukB
LFSQLKYFFLFCYEAADQMEEKSSVFAEQRAKRMEAFRTERQAAEEKARAKVNQMRNEVRQQVKDALKQVGVANKDEMNEVKALLTELAAKVDKLSEK